MSMGEMAAVRQVQSHDGVARRHHRPVGGLVGLRTRVRLHVHILRAEDLLGALARQVLHHVGVLATAVITLARIALRVFVGEHAGGGFQHGLGSKILARDQLQLSVLTGGFVLNGIVDLRIHFGERAGHAFSFGHLSVPRDSGRDSRYFSNWAILATRRAWRPPANSVFRKMSISFMARFSSMYLAPRVSTLASLCSLVIFTSSWLCQGAARTPSTLLAAIAIPIPVEQTSMPRSLPPCATSRPTARAKSGQSHDSRLPVPKSTTSYPSPDSLRRSCSLRENPAW